MMEQRKKQNVVENVEPTPVTKDVVITNPKPVVKDVVKEQVITGNYNM